MGATGSAQKRKKSSLPDGLYVEKIKVTIDRRPTVIDEKSHAVLKYRTPHFRASASVSLPALEKGDLIQVGWVQACTHMMFNNTYGSDGVSSWEFPEINSGKFPMISDSDGRGYPWYGSKQELHKSVGPSEPKTIQVLMNDNFFPQVTWHIPDGRPDRTAKLTHIERDQTFYAWLVIQNLNDHSFHVLKTTKWNMRIDIIVDPSKPLGQRAHLTGPAEQKQPDVLTDNVPIPSCALHPPNANNSQVLVWRPSQGKAVVVVPPIETTMSMHKYLISSSTSMDTSSFSLSSHVDSHH